MDIKTFIDSIPKDIQIDALEGKYSVFHFDFHDSGHYTARIDEGRIKVAEGHEGEATCTVKITPENFSKLVKGELQPTMALMTGKLKVSKPMELIQYAKLFGIG